MIRWIVGLLCALNLWAVDAIMDITKGVGTQVKVAIEPMSSAASLPDIQLKMMRMIETDLRVLDAFEPQFATGSKAFGERPSETQFQSAGASLWIQYRLIPEGAGAQLEAWVFERGKNTALQKKYVVTSLAMWPFLAHKLAVSVNELIGAIPVPWMERFVVLARRTGKARESEILVGDYSLQFTKSIIRGGANIFPKWANKEQSAIYYTEIRDGVPTLLRFDLFSGQKQTLLTSNGMLTCTDVSQDGRKLLLSMAPDGLTDIFLYDLANKGLKNLTKHPAIDVSVNFTDDEKRVVFVSDRLGFPTVFVKDLDGDGVQQLVFQGRQNIAVTALGDTVIYVARDRESPVAGNTFNLYQINPKDTSMRQLTASGANHHPRISRLGDAVMFTKNDAGRGYLGVIRMQTNRTTLFPLDFSIDAIDW